MKYYCFGLVKFLLENIKVKDNKLKYKNFLMPYLNPVYKEGCNHESDFTEQKKANEQKRKKALIRVIKWEKGSTTKEEK